VGPRKKLGYWSSWDFFEVNRGDIKRYTSEAMKNTRPDRPENAVAINNI